MKRIIKAGLPVQWTEKGISLNKYLQEAIQNYVQETEASYQTRRK